jgi:heme/copper-type cytochrome/quinol oxidase subunit 2
LAADPTNPALLYLALSYPTEVYRYDQDNGNSKPWTSLTPQAEQQADALQNSIMPVVYVIVAVLFVVLIILFRRYTKARIKRRKRQ